MDKGSRRATENRGQVIVRISDIGILANIILAVFKAFVGMVSNSIAVTMTASAIDAMTRRIQDKIYREYAVIMVAIGIDSVNTNNDFVSHLYEILDGFP